jgi:2-hydroxychromene-2-carboxylate isomerase
VKHITFYFDVVSPYAWLAFERLPEALQGLSYSVAYRPVLLGGLLQLHDNRAPVSIAPKRDWIYRHAAWLGHAQGTRIDLPAQHPFSSLALLRQALACSDDGAVNRYVAGTVLRHVWQGGMDALDPVRLEVLAQQLEAQVKNGHSAHSEPVKALLRTNTDAAGAAGAFGVPTFGVDGRLFWGHDALPMLRAYLAEDPWFEGDQWNAVCQRPRAN